MSFPSTGKITSINEKEHYLNNSAVVGSRQHIVAVVLFLLVCSLYLLDEALAQRGRDHQLNIIGKFIFSKWYLFESL